MTHLVSAVIPCFNYGSFVARAIESVLNQTHRSIECIVVNDGSTDGTSDVLRQFDGRIRTIEQPHRGVSAARNTGILVSRGEFIAFLDGDDWWQPRKIEQQLALLNARSNLGCVGCGLEHIYPDGRIERIPGKRNFDNRHDTHRKIGLRRFWVSGSGSGGVLRRAVLEKVGLFDEQLVAAEDWDMWLRLAAQTEIDNVEPVLTSINRHGTGVFRNAGLMEENQTKVYRKIVDRWPTLLSSGDRRRIRALILADAARESPIRAHAMSYYLRSLKEWPFSYPRIRSAAILTLRSIQAAVGARSSSNSA